MCRSGDVTNTTRVVKWYWASRGGYYAARYVPNITCMVERHHPPICHPDRNEMEWRDLPKLQTLPYAGYFRYLGRFLHSADAAVGMTYLWGGFVYPHRLLLRRPQERHTGRSLRFRWWVVPFNHTGYIRNVAGGKIAAPTCTSVSGTVQPCGFYSEHHPYMRNTFTLSCPQGKPVFLNAGAENQLVIAGFRVLLYVEALAGEFGDDQFAGGVDDAPGAEVAAQGGEVLPG